MYRLVGIPADIAPSHKENLTDPDMEFSSSGPDDDNDNGGPPTEHEAEAGGDDDPASLLMRNTHVRRESGNAAAAAALGFGSQILATPADIHHLSPLVCHVRYQIELFPATTSDCTERTVKSSGLRKSGLISKIHPRQVGIRCIHCKDLPGADRAKGASSFPASIQLLNQSVRNFQRHHFVNCAEIPPGIKSEYDRLKQKRAISSKDSSAHWVRSCYERDLVDVASGGIYHRDDVDRSGGTLVAVEPPPETMEIRNLPGRGGDDGGKGRRGRSTRKPQKAAASSHKIPSDKKEKRKANGNKNKKNKGAPQSPRRPPTPPQSSVSQIATAAPAYAADAAVSDLAALGLDDCFDGDDILFGDAAAVADAAREVETAAVVRTFVYERQGTSKTALLSRDDDEDGDKVDEVDDASMASYGSKPKAAAAPAVPAGDVAPVVVASDPAAIKPAPASSRRRASTLSSISAYANMGPGAGAAEEMMVMPLTDGADGLGTRSRPSIRLSYCSVLSAGAASSLGMLDRDDAVEMLDLIGSFDQRQEALIEMVRRALQIVADVVQERKKGDGEGNARDEVALELVQLGRDFHDMLFNLVRDKEGEDPQQGPGGNTCSSLETENENEDDNLAPKKKARASPTVLAGDHPPLHQWGVPVSLSILVDSLLQATDDEAPERYTSATDVADDLRSMISDPERFLFDTEVDEHAGKLAIPPEGSNALYGRNDVLERLRHMFDRSLMVGSAPEMVLLAGVSGVGKSSVANSLRQPVEDRGGLWITGKFDELRQHQTQPLSVVFGAFEDVCREINEREDENADSAKRAIREALNGGAGVLAGLMPNLGRIIGDVSSLNEAIDGQNALRQFLHYFRLFYRSLFASVGPVVLFFDDVQWADAEALSIIETIASDMERSCSTFIVIAVRDEEVGPEHALNKLVANVSKAGVVTSSVKLNDMDIESLNTMVADAMHLSPRLTYRLSVATHAKTNGNPFYSSRFIGSLADEGLIRFSLASRRYVWDIAAIEAKEPFGIVDLLLHKLQGLDGGCRSILKVAACLGPCKESTLRLIGASYGMDTFEVNTCLRLLLSEGLMNKANTRFIMAHDRITETAYSLVPAAEREQEHYYIGRILWENMDTGIISNDDLFTIVDQLSRGSSMIVDSDEQRRFAEVCLLAGKRAAAASSFLSASIYCLQGCTKLKESDWQSHYSLCLELHSLSGEMQYATGNNGEEIQLLLNPVMAHGRCFDDKLRAHMTILRSLGSRGRLNEAISYGLTVLDGLGEHLPRHPNQIQIALDFLRCQLMEVKSRVIDRSAIEGLVTMGDMVDGHKLAAMKILHILTSFCFQVQPELMGLIIFRMVQLSRSHGICPESSLGFAAFGLVISCFGDIDKAYRYGKLALSILDNRTSDRNLHVPSVYLVVYFMVNIFREPVQACVEQLRHACEIGKSVGDVEWTLINAGAEVELALKNGFNLKDLLGRIRGYLGEMKKYNHYSHLVTLPPYQTILNLIDDEGTGDPTILTGAAMDQAAVLDICMKDGNNNLACMIGSHRLWLANIFNRHDAAKTVILEFHQSRHGFQADDLVHFTFNSGLAAAWIARNEGRSQGMWRKQANTALASIRDYATNHSAWNFEAKHHILAGEVHYMNGNVNDAASCFKEAITVADERNFPHEKALAYERLGILYSETGSVDAAKEAFESAYKAYLEWGARRKARAVYEERLALKGSAADSK